MKTSCVVPVIAASAALLLAACAQRDAAGGATQAVNATLPAKVASSASPLGAPDSPATGVVAIAPGGAAGLAIAASPSAIASMPDRGELLEYSSVRRPRTAGKYSFYPVEVSEAHAFAAIGGALRLRAPDGTPVDLDYERHVEHDSGDWSWIGRDANGIDAILTFGEKAMFGVFASASGDSLRLTTSAGEVWMVEQDGRRESDLERGIREGRIGPDYRIPRIGAAASAPSTLTAGAAIATVGAVPAAAGDPTIDLLLGYTSGFAMMMGGASQVQTRLNHVVTVGNQALINSQVAAGLRLVGTLQVNYSDSGSNDSALNQLTGSDGEAPVTVPASLRPLREERERLGADLVSLVRRFNNAEHEGCGIAWLIGGGQSEIYPGHEAFGYSVISDSNGTLGSDGGHYCRDETLAHELGHNLGSAHDIETANSEGSQGRYPYSHGYKTGVAAGNFYTVMAYGDTGQTGYRVFSNPQVSICGGRACGVANQADNARSLRQTIPLIAAFRASQIAPAPTRVWRSGDFDNDGRADLFWRNFASGSNQIWPGANSGAYRSLATIADTGWTVAAAGDFDGDGHDDIVWRHMTTGDNTIWRSGEFGSQLGVQRVPSQDWQIVGADDFTGDGRADLLWRNFRTGENQVWPQGQSAFYYALGTVVDQAWKVAGTGDFDGDGRADIVWRNTTSGINTIWRQGSYAAQIPVQTVGSQDWQIVGADDFTGDGRTDLLWRNFSTGENQIWPSAQSAGYYPLGTVVDQAWIVATTGDFDGDGRADIAWRNTSSGDNTIWRSGDAASRLSVQPVVSQTWQIVP